MKGTIKNIEQVTAASGNTYSKIFFNEEEYANRKIITFSKENLEIGKEYEFTVKENPDTSLVVTPKKTFNGFNKASSVDYKVEALKATIELIKVGIIQVDQLNQSTKKIYDTLNGL